MRIPPKKITLGLTLPLPLTMGINMTISLFLTRHTLHSLPAKRKWHSPLPLLLLILQSLCTIYLPKDIALSAYLAIRFL